MRIRSLSLTAIVTLVIFASGVHQTAKAQQITTSPFDIIQQKPDYVYKDLRYCNNIFVREPATAYTKTIYIRFHYRNEKKEIIYEEAPLEDVTVIIVPDKTLDSPKGKMVGLDDHKQNLWYLIMTEQIQRENSACLAGIATQNGTL